MKKLLAILVLAGLYLAVAPGRQLQVVTPGKITKGQKMSLSRLDERPSSLFEISQLTPVSGNNCRQQNPDISIDNGPAPELRSPVVAGADIESQLGLGTKKYLRHNYPTHNFW